MGVPVPSGGLITKDFARLWWIAVFVGALALIAGILVLVFPGRSLLLLELAFGIYLIIYGLMRVIAAIIITGGSGGQRALIAIIGLIAIAVGILIATTPGFGLATLALLFALWLLFVGGFSLIAGIVNEEGRGYNLLIAFLAIAAGVVVIAQPKIGLVTVAIVGAIYLILVGIVEIAAGLSLRRLAKQM